MRMLSQIETERVKSLTRNSVSLALIQPTETALKKSIMDATGTVRSYLKNNGIHDYQDQKKGRAHKRLIDSAIITDRKKFGKKTSLYRPETKDGDPRIWVYGLKEYAKPDDIIGLIYFEKLLYVINLSSLDIHTLLESNENNPLKELVNEINVFSNEIADELLWKLRRLSKTGPVKSLLDADTSVGRTLETALDIKINSSKKPDYKGIELKSFRSKRNNRKTLFGKVPNWKLSKLKSSSQILDAFGYWRDGGFKLNCTVSTQNRNPQGLTLKLNTDLEHLIENSNNPKFDDFAVWTLDELHKSLVAKHNETFWIEADVLKIQGEEYFDYTITEHTRKPIVSQFDILLEQGIITLDHLIKRTSTGKVSERGPLFKIKPNSLDLLFPPSKTYSL